MPHKRAKRSVREKKKKEQGVDLAPWKESLSSESIPKSISRVLNAAKIRTDWKDKKRKLDEDEESQKPVKRAKIQQGESLQHFNKRIENDMRPLVRAAARQAKKHKKPQTKQEDEDEDDKDSPPPDKHANHPKEFEKLSSSAPRRLNDVAQAPPEFKKPPVKGSVPSKKDGIVSMAQKARMAEEREKAILRYRQLKAARSGGGGGEEDS